MVKHGSAESNFSDFPMLATSRSTFLKHFLKQYQLISGLHKVSVINFGNCMDMKHLNYLDTNHPSWVQIIWVQTVCGYETSGKPAYK